MTETDLQQFYHELKTNGWIKRRNLYGPGLSDRSVRGCHLICRVVLDKAVEEQIICVNPAQFCKPPGESRRETQVLTREEMQQLLIQAKADSCYELLLLELSIGLRRGELLALQWEDLDLQTGALQISRQVSRVRGKLTISPPKTDATVRTILLAPAVLEQLRRYRQEVYSRWMFPSPKDPDSPRDPLEVRKLLMRVLERGKYLKIRLHNIRALRHYGDGVRYECEDSLGGGGTRLRRDYTEHIYTHVTESMARQATAKIDWGIGGQTGTPIPEIDSRSAPYQDFTVNPGKLRKPGTGCASQIKRLSVGGTVFSTVAQRETVHPHGLRPVFLGGMRGKAAGAYGGTG